MDDTNGLGYEVRLENYPNEFIKSFSYFLQKQLYVDVLIVCECKMIKVHGLVLAACSKYFRDAFPDEYLELTVVFKSHYSVIMSIIEFIYYGKTTFSGENIKEIVSAAKYLGIKGLSDIVFDDSVELPTFFPPNIIESKQYIKINSQFVKRPNIFEKNNHNSFILKIPIKTTGVEAQNILYNNRKENFITNIKGKVNSTKNNKKISNVTMVQIRMEEIKSRNLFQYLSNFMDGEIADSHLNEAVDAIKSLNNDSTEGMNSDTFLGQNTGLENDEFTMVNFNNDNEYDYQNLIEVESSDNSENVIDENMVEYQIITEEPQIGSLFVIE